VGGRRSGPFFNGRQFRRRLLYVSMAKTIKKVILHTEGPCPCGSGKAIADCHLDIDGRFRKPCPSLRPSGPVTGFSHTRCYLRETCDCSEQLSREHYVSKSVLEQLGGAAAVSGTPWLDPALNSRSGISRQKFYANATTKHCRHWIPKPQTFFQC
jgi:hypothetical protein